MRTRLMEFAKLLSSNSTDSSFASKVPTVTEPTGTGVLELSSIPGSMSDNILLVPFGAGNDDTTFVLRLIGWRKVSALWVPIPLCQVTATLSTAVGVSGAAVTDSDRFADTLALASGFNSNVSTEIVSPTGNIIAHVMQDVKGFAKVEITFDMTGATSGNALYALL